MGKKTHLSWYLSDDFEVSGPGRDESACGKAGAKALYSGHPERVTCKNCLRALKALLGQKLHEKALFDAAAEKRKNARIELAHAILSNPDVEIIVGDGRVVNFEKLPFDGFQYGFPIGEGYHLDVDKGEDEMEFYNRTFFEPGEFTYEQPHGV